MRGAVLVKKTLRDVRTATIAIAGTCLAMALFTVLIYPQFSGAFEDVELPSLYDGFTGGLDITSPEGFLNAEFFSWIPLLLITLAIIAGTGILAGEESSGAMDQLLAQPIRRRDVVLQKVAGVTIAILVATVAAVPGMLVAAMMVDFDTSWPRLIFATLNMAPLALLYLGISTWASATLPTRSAAAVVAVGLAVVPFLLNTVLTAANLAEPVRMLTPFYWGEATKILAGEARWAPAAVFLAGYAALTWLTVLSFERRDIAVRGWNPLLGLRRRFARTDAEHLEAAQAEPR